MVLKIVARYKELYDKEDFPAILDLDKNTLENLKKNKEEHFKIQTYVTQAHKNLSDQLLLASGLGDAEKDEIQRYFDEAREKLLAEIVPEPPPRPTEVPIIAFFGTKGGVGKSTIANEFAKQITLAENKPNVLLIDIDFSARSTTIIHTDDNFNCKTLIDYIKQSQEKYPVDVEELINITNSNYEMHKYYQGLESGRLFLLPSTKPNEKIFEIIKPIDYRKLREIIKSIIDNTVEKCNISCVVIDCDPTFTTFPITPAAVRLSTRSFIIGEYGEISAQTTASVLQSFATQIKNFYEDFDQSKTKVIINKLPLHRMEEFKKWNQPGIFGVPLTLNLVSPGDPTIEDKDEIPMLALKGHVYHVLRKTFEEKNNDLIPDPQVILLDKWRMLIRRTSDLFSSHRLRFYYYLKPNARILLSYIVSFIAAYLAISQFVYGVSIINGKLYSGLLSILLWIVGIWNYYKSIGNRIELTSYLEEVRNQKAFFLIEILPKSMEGRKKLIRLRKLAEKLR